MQTPNTPFDGVKVFDADTINGLGFLPKSIAIVGSGIIAIEYAKIFRKLGAKVTLLVRSQASSALDRMGIDVDVAKKLLKGLKEDEVDIREGTSVKMFENVSDKPGKLMRLQLMASKGGADLGTLEVDIFLAATGRIPNTKAVTQMGLIEAGVRLGKKGHIEVNSNLEAAPNLYAAGDVIVGPALASTGVEQAQRAVANMFEAKLEEVDNFPVGVWTIPEMAYFGLTKAKAETKGYFVEEGTVGYNQCLRGRVFAPDGFLKLVFCVSTYVILGVHIIGKDACELVHYGMDLVTKKATIFDVIGTLFTAVTFHELFKEAALNGDSKLEFGIQWQGILNVLSTSLPVSEVLSSGLARRKFDEIDTSGDGSLDEEELTQALKGMGADVGESFVANLVHLADDDGNGTIEWPEFERIFIVLAALEESRNVVPV